MNTKGMQQCLFLDFKITIMEEQTKDQNMEQKVDVLPSANVEALKQ